MEYFLNKKHSLLLQSGISSTPYPSVNEVTSLEHPPVHIGFGWNVRFSDETQLKVSLIENGTSASPDLTFHAGIKSKF